MAAACAGTPANFSAVQGREWYLSELRGPSGIIMIDRELLDADGMGDVYSLRFDEGRISGKGAPNRYMAPYTEERDGLTLGPVAGTQMAALKEPEALKEREYFAYLNRVTRWSLKGDRLELTTVDEQGRAAALVFVEHK
jgi:heat shock protein HslJ